MENLESRKQFLSLVDVAALLGVARQSAYRIVVQQGRIPHVKHGRNVRVPLSAWQAWLSAQHEAAMSEVVSKTQEPR